MVRGAAAWEQPRRSASRMREAVGWDALLLAVAVFLLASVARIHLLFPVLEALQVTMVAGAGALLFYLVNHHPARRFGALGSPTTVLLGVFVAWMALTVPFSIAQERAGLFVIDNFLKTAALFVLIVGSVRGVKDVERLAWVYFGGAALYAGVTLLRATLGDAPADPTDDSWRLGGATTYDANDFALFVVSAVPMGVYFLSDAARSARTRLLALLGLGVMGIAFVQTGSRGGLLAMGAVIVFLLLRHRAIPFRWRVTGIGLLGLALAAFASQQYWEQMTTLLNPAQDYNFTAETGRIQIWTRGLDYLWGHPVTGVGASNFPVAEGLLSPFAFRQELGVGVRWTAPHNSFLQVAVELGIPGLILFLALLGSAFVALRRMEISREGGGRPALAQALMGSLFGFLVGAFFLSLAYSAILFALLALAAALRKTTGIGPDRVGDDRYWNPMTTRAPRPEDAGFITR